MLGISDATLRHWLKKGQFGYGGELVLSPTGKRWRLYAVAELERAHQAMKRAAGEETQGLEDARAWPPAGFVEKDEVARLCGVRPESLKAWVQRGKLPPGRLAKKPGSRAYIRVFPEHDVWRLAEEIRAEAEAPFPPPGFVDRYGAAAMFEMHTSQFILWQRLGRIRCASQTVSGVLPVPPTVMLPTTTTGAGRRSVRKAPSR